MSLDSPKRPTTLALGQTLYNKSRPVVSDAVCRRVREFLAEKVSLPAELAIDVGCGTGFSTLRFADAFHHIIGIDTSHSQIEQAKNANPAVNVEYRVGTADALPTTSNSTDAVLCLQSAHWFNMTKFFAECDRILRPNGVIAIMGYGLIRLKCLARPELDEKLNAVLKELHWDLLHKAGHWNEERLIVDRQFPDLQFPYPDQPCIRDDPSLYLEKPLTVDSLMDLVESWSGLRNYKEQNPDHDILEETKSKILVALEEPCASAAVVNAVFPWFLLMCRKPS